MKQTDNFLIMKKCIYPFLFIAFCYHMLSCSEEASIKAIQLNKKEIELLKGESEILKVSFTPARGSNNELTWVSTNVNVATVNDGIVVGVAPGNAEIIVKCGDATDRCSVLVLSCPKGCVDLGIVMTRDDGTTYNLYWAECNLGAENAEDYGDYYAWGEIKPYYTEGHAFDNPCDSWEKGKTGYNWESYSWCNMTESTLTLTKYNCNPSYGIVDNKTVLERGEYFGETNDDAASVALGGKWRMPSESEWSYLLKQCEASFVIQNRIEGIELKGPNGNSIFLPAAGGRNDDIISGFSNDCNYWSSSLKANDSFIASGVIMTAFDNEVVIFQGGGYRFRGFSIRPVTE